MEEEPKFLDIWGYSIQTQSSDCIKSINSYFFQFITFGRNRNAIIQATVHDPVCVLANTLAAFQISSKEPVKASSFLDVAKNSLDSGIGTKYERMVFEAISCMIGIEKNVDAAISKHFELLNEFPRDLASLRRAHLICFYTGRPDTLLEFVEQVLPYNEDQSYMYGMLSFPLLELGRMAEAENAAKKGYEMNKYDVWSQHNLCHVLQHECHYREAVDFMLSCSSTWNSCMSFMYTHCWWHVALCYLEGHAPLQKVLEIYDNHIWKELERSDAECTEVYANALGLLLKIYVRGHSSFIDDRIMDVATKLEDQSTWHIEWNLDILGVWALAYKKSIKAEELLESVKARINSMSKEKQHLMQMGVKLAEAMYEYGKGNYQKAYDMLPSDFDAVNCKMIGASDEQLDVFNEVWYNILLCTKQFPKVVVELEKAVKKREGVPFLWRLLAKAYTEEGMAEAHSAAKKANALESAYFK